MFLRKQDLQSTYENSTAAFHACKVSQALAEQTQQSCHMEAISLHTLKKVFLLSSSMSLFLSWLVYLGKPANRGSFWSSPEIQQLILVSHSISYPAPEIPARKRCFNAERGLNSGVTGLDDFDFKKLLLLQVDQSRIQGTLSGEAGTKDFLDISNTFLSPSSSTLSSIAAPATFCSRASFFSNHPLFSLMRCDSQAWQLDSLTSFIQLHRHIWRWSPGRLFQQKISSTASYNSSPERTLQKPRKNLKQKPREYLGKTRDLWNKRPRKQET